MSFLSSIFRQAEPTNEGWHRHANPDGSIGGFVSDEARLGKDVYVEYSGIITAGATVEDGARVRCGDFVQADGTTSRLAPYPSDFEYQPVFPKQE
jgi:hypothetical protein